MTETITQDTDNAPTEPSLAGAPTTLEAWEAYATSRNEQHRARSQAAAVLAVGTKRKHFAHATLADCEALDDARTTIMIELAADLFALTQYIINHAELAKTAPVWPVQDAEASHFWSMVLGGASQVGLLNEMQEGMAELFQDTPLSRTGDAFYPSFAGELDAILSQIIDNDDETPTEV